MDLTISFQHEFGSSILDRYIFCEVRNASSIIRATNSSRFDDIERVLANFDLLDSDLLVPGGQESQLAARLNNAFRDLGWREGRIDTIIKLSLLRMPYRPSGETTTSEMITEVVNHGYKVDNIFDRVALDVEWNAKDGNLDRDISAYRALYDAGLIDAAVIITRTLELRDLGRSLGLRSGLSATIARRILNTTTTTNLTKLRPKLERGDAGGCPVLVIAICDRTWEHFDEDIQ